MTHEHAAVAGRHGGALASLVGGYYSTEDIAQDVNFGLGEDYGELIGALLTAAGAGHWRQSAYRSFGRYPSVVPRNKLLS
jgi:hypothetical protein